MAAHGSGLKKPPPTSAFTWRRCMSTRGCAKGAHHSDDWAATAATDFQNKNSLSGLKAANEESMYNLTIHFGPNAVAWSFLFKSKEKAESFFEGSIKFCDQNAALIIEDDYGQKAVLYPGSINGVLLENTELATEARILRGIDNAKGQAR